MFANGLDDWGSIPARIIPKTQKMVLTLLNNQNYEVWIKGKLSNPEKEVAPFPQCVVIEKGAFGSPLLDFGDLLYFKNIES